MVNLHENLGRYLAAATRHMTAYMARRVEPLGLGAGQYPYLFALYKEDGQTQQSLSDRLLVDKSATVGAIDRLEALGYVARCTDPDDRRHYRIHLTERGRAIRPDLEAIVAEVQEVMLEGLSDQERAALLQSLRHVTANLTRRT